MPLHAIRALKLRHKRRRRTPSPSGGQAASMTIETVEVSLYQLLLRAGLEPVDAAEECIAARPRLAINAKGCLMVRLHSLGWVAGWGQLITIAEEIRIHRQLEDRAEGRIQARQRDHTPPANRSRTSARRRGITIHRGN